MSVCGNFLNSSVNVYAAGTSGYIAIGVSKLVGFIILYGYNWNNNRLAKQAGGGFVVKGLVLPLYSEYLNLLLGLTFVCAIIDIASVRDKPIVQLYALSIQ